MSWIKLGKRIFDKPEVIAISEHLDMPEPHVVGCLASIWVWFDDHTDGVVSGVTKTFLDRRVGVSGFAEAMERVGWLKVHDDGIEVPEFEVHNGAGKKRAVTAKRVANHKGNAKGNARSVTKALPERYPESFELHQPRQKCPYKEIVNLYHELLPMCRRVAQLTEARKSHIRARWESDMDSLDVWRDYFSYVAKSKFLTGQCEAPEGRKRFQADIDWLIRPANITKVEEGKYHE